ncbi:MAG: heavy-metal-associated domain-containing protein [Syntrophales bacterium]|nr:heavy-metal-associated domain-containing protein [Syntrophales bacterium]MDY0044488.1 heavy metal-associated domain-containing protein [Syntrophales bacterium]
MKKVKIKGMSCRHCVHTVEKALQEIEGIENVQVNLERGEATFEETKEIPMETIKENIKKAGYEVE